MARSGWPPLRWAAPSSVPLPPSPSQHTTSVSFKFKFKKEAVNPLRTQRPLRYKTPQSLPPRLLSLESQSSRQQTPRSSLSISKRKPKKITKKRWSSEEIVWMRPRRAPLLFSTFPKLERRIKTQTKNPQASRRWEQAELQDTPRLPLALFLKQGVGAHLPLM